MAKEFESEYPEITLDENFQPSDVLYEKRPLHEHLISFLKSAGKVIDKLPLEIVIYGGIGWLIGNALVNVAPHPLPLSVAPFFSKEIVPIATFIGVLIGGSEYYKRTH